MRRCLAALLAAVAVALPVVAVAAGAPARYTYGASADASALEQSLTVIQVASGAAVDGRYPHAQALIGSPSQARGLASVFDPGALVQSIPPQVRDCSTAVPGCRGGAPVPDYPFVAEASWPSQERASGGIAAQDFGPTHAGGGSYAATVSAVTATATARGQAVELGPAPVRAGDGEASASAAWSDGVATSAAASTLAGISIAGVVDIAQVHSAVTARAAAGAPGAASGSLILTRVSVSGVPAEVDARGVHLAGQALPAAAAIAAAQQGLDQLRQAGTTIRLVPPAQVATSGQVSYVGEALEVSGNIPGGGPRFTIDIGRLSVSALALREPGALLPLQAAAALTTTDGGPPADPGTAAVTSAPAAAPLVPARALRAPGAAVAGPRPAPATLLIALFGIVEVALLGGSASLLWPRAAAPPQRATLRRL